jgi:hypothetical protein
MGKPPFDISTSVPIDDCGERHLYLATSAKFPPREGDNKGVRLGEGVATAAGADGTLGTGLYSVAQDCEGTTDRVVKLLGELRESGVGDALWKHTQEEFERVGRI